MLVSFSSLKRMQTFGSNGSRPRPKMQMNIYASNVHVSISHRMVWICSRSHESFTHSVLETGTDALGLPCVQSNVDHYPLGEFCVPYINDAVVNMQTIHAVLRDIDQEFHSALHVRMRSSGLRWTMRNILERLWGMYQRKFLISFWDTRRKRTEFDHDQELVWTPLGNELHGCSFPCQVLALENICIFAPCANESDVETLCRYQVMGKMLNSLHFSRRPYG